MSRALGTDSPFRSRKISIAQTWTTHRERTNPTLPAFPLGSTRWSYAYLQLPRLHTTTHVRPRGVQRQVTITSRRLARRKEKKLCVGQATRGDHDASLASLRVPPRLLSEGSTMIAVDQAIATLLGDAARVPGPAQKGEGHGQGEAQSRSRYWRSDCHSQHRRRIPILVLRLCMHSIPRNRRTKEPRFADRRSRRTTIRISSRPRPASRPRLCATSSMP